MTLKTKLTLFISLALLGCKEHKLPRIAHIHVYCIKVNGRLQCSNFFPEKLNERPLSKAEVVGWVEARRYEGVLPAVQEDQCTVKTRSVVYTNASCIFTGGYIPINDNLEKD